MDHNTELAKTAPPKRQFYHRCCPFTSNRDRTARGSARHSACRKPHGASSAPSTKSDPVCWTRWIFQALVTCNQSLVRAMCTTEFSLAAKTRLHVPASWLPLAVGASSRNLEPPPSFSIVIFFVHPCKVYRLYIYSACDHQNPTQAQMGY